MANSDKNILITPNVGQVSEPTIEFTGADATPLTLRVLDDGTVSFEGTAGQLFSISDGLTGVIFSVNDISGIPNIEVLDTGEIKFAPFGGIVTAPTATAGTNTNQIATTAFVTNALSGAGGASVSNTVPAVASEGSLYFNSNDYTLNISFSGAWLQVGSVASINSGSASTSTFDGTFDGGGASTSVFANTLDGGDSVSASLLA